MYLFLRRGRERERKKKNRKDDGIGMLMSIDYKVSQKKKLLNYKIKRKLSEKKNNNIARTQTTIYKNKNKIKNNGKNKINKTTDSLIIPTQTLAQKGRRGTQRKPFQPGASENETNHLLH